MSEWEVAVKIGGRAVPVSRMNSKSSMNELPTAEFTLEQDADPPVDFTPIAQIFWVQENEPGETYPMFTGNVTSAVIRDGVWNVIAEGGRAMAESQVGLLMVGGNMPGVDVVKLLCLQTGTPLEIEDPELEQIPSEVFVVEMPIMGIEILAPVTFSGVDFLPIGGEDSSPFRTAAPAIEARWGTPTGRARVYVTSRWASEADQVGGRKIEVAIDILAALACYGLSRDPWGYSLDFDRGRSRARPSVIPVIFSQGVTTGRRWIHDVVLGESPDGLNVGEFVQRWPRVSGMKPTAAVTRGLRALRDAGDETRELLDRCHALSSVLEFYVADTKPPKAVTKASLKAVRNAIGELDMADSERERILKVVGQANAAPLLAKVRHQAERDGVHVGDEEWDLLARLRSARNDFVHGRTSSRSSVTVDDVRWGMSLCSRLLLFHWTAKVGVS